MKTHRQLIIWLVALLAALVLAACTPGQTPPAMSMLTVTKAGTGTGTVTSDPEGINCGTDCEGEFAEGTEVVLTAAPDAEATVAWSGPCATATGNTCDLVIGADDAAVTVTFTAPDGNNGGGEVPAGRVAGFADTAEEFVTASTSDATNYPTGHTYTDSSDLELAYDPSHGTEQYVGVRFADADIAADATVTEAYIEFSALGGSTGTVTLTIVGQLATDAGAFQNDADATGSSDISNRPTTTASVTWEITETWTAGTVYQTPNLAPIIAELQGQAGWTDDSPIVFIITSQGGDQGGEFRRADSVLSAVDTLATAPRLIVNPPAE